MKSTDTRLMSGLAERIGDVNDCVSNYSYTKDTQISHYVIIRVFGQIYSALNPAESIIQLVLEENHEVS